MLELGHMQSLYKEQPPLTKLQGLAGWTCKQRLRPKNDQVPFLKSKVVQCRGVQRLMPQLAALLHEVSPS